MGVIVGVSVAAVGGLLVWPWRNWKASAGRAIPPTPQKIARAASPLRLGGARTLPPANRHVSYRGLHLHFHGVDAEDVAEILCRQLP
jgi:hypothetical protein